VPGCVPALLVPVHVQKTYEGCVLGRSDGSYRYLSVAHTSVVLICVFESRFESRKGTLCHATVGSRVSPEAGRREARSWYFINDVGQIERA
jgi:hypothetical protein